MMLVSLFLRREQAPALPYSATFHRSQTTESQLLKPSPAGKGDREAVDEENFLSCLPPGGRGTAKRWKEPAGTEAEQKTLQRADIEFAPTML